jgi:D-3-phosphoglycerate dehydrogenase
MKNETLSKILVKRISSSPYFSSSFNTSEMSAVSKINNVEMLPFDSSELADILITNTHTEVESISEEQIKRTQLMIHPNSGYDNFSAEFVNRANFPIIVGNPIRAHAVTNFILSALLNHYSPIPKQKTWSKERLWPRKLLSELTILIIGYGHIGKLLKKSLESLVAEVRVYDPYNDRPNCDFKNSDVVIPACSLNSRNFHFVNLQRLMDCQENFLLINAARGPLVNTTDLINVLSKRPEAFAVLDVFEQEPCDFKQFSGLKNISVSSHIAGVYKNIDSMTIDFNTTVIKNFREMPFENFNQHYKNMILKNRLIENDFLI